MLVKGYLFSEVYKNNKHNFKEQALTYNGDVLSIMNNKDGVVTINQVTNDELLKHIGTFKQPLMKRLEDSFNVSKKKRKTTSKSRSKKHHSERRTKSKTNKHEHSKIHLHTKRKSKSRSRSQRSKRHTERKSKSRSKKRDITPDIMKTIF